MALGTGNNGGEFGFASFSGKTTYMEPEVDGNVGNHTFVAYVEDHGEPGAGTDRFWLEIRDGNGDIVMDLSIWR